MHRVVVAALVLIVVGCHPAQRTQLHRYEGGWRLTDEGQIMVWMGDNCEDVTAIDIVATRDNDEFAGRYESTDSAGSDISQLVWGETPDGFEVVEELEADWRDVEVLRVRVEIGDSRTVSSITLDSWIEEAEEQPSEWYVDDEGWLTEDEYREFVEDDEGVSPLCRIAAE